MQQLATTKNTNTQNYYLTGVTSNGGDCWQGLPAGPRARRRPPQVHQTGRSTPSRQAPARLSPPRRSPPRPPSSPPDPPPQRPIQRVGMQQLLHPRRRRGSARHLPRSPRPSSADLRPRRRLRDGLAPSEPEASRRREGGGGGERAGGVAGEGDDEAEERGGRGRRFGGNGVGDAAGARSPPLILGGFFWKLPTNTCTRTTAGKRNRQRIIHVHARRTIVHGPARAHTGLYDWSTRAIHPPEMTIVPLVTNRHRRIWTVLVFFPLAFSPGGSTGAEKIVNVIF